MRGGLMEFLIVITLLLILTELALLRDNICTIWYRIEEYILEEKDK